MNIIGIIFIAIFVGVLVWVFLFIQKVKKDGIEREAVVVRIDEEEEEDSDGNITTRKNYIVGYTTQEGQQVEGTLVNPKRWMQVGSRMKIRYLPGKEKSPVMTEQL